MDGEAEEIVKAEEAVNPDEANTSFVAVADLAASLGVNPINQLPGCWECQVDAKWWFAVNGHIKPSLCTHSDLPIEPFHCYVEYNGWPAGLFNPIAGVIATGDGANEDAFIAALRAAAARSVHQDQYGSEVGTSNTDLINT